MVNIIRLIKMAEYTGKIVKRNTKYDLNLPPLDGRNNMSEAGDFDEPPPFHGEVGALDARLTAGMKKGSSEYTGERVRKPAPETNPTSWDARQKAMYGDVSPKIENNQDRRISGEDGNVIQDLKNFGAGALSLTRGALNIGNEAYNDTKRHTNPAIAPAKQKLQPKEMLGDKLLLPKGTDKESAAYGFGTIFDPASLAIGGGVSKVLPYAPVTGGSFKQGVTALGKNMLSGGVTGGIIGGLSEDGNAVDGAMAGAAANVAIPALLKTGGYFGKKGIELFDPILSIEGKQRAAARVANAAAGNTGNKAQIADLLTQAKLGQTATDAILPANNPEMVALQKIIGEKRPDLTFADELARDLTARKAIDKIARTDEIYNAAIARRKEVTEPMRRTVMQAASTADEITKKYAPILRQQEKIAERSVQGVRNMNSLEEQVNELGRKGQARLGYDPKDAIGNSVGMSKIGKEYTYPNTLENVAKKEGEKLAARSLLAGERARFAKSTIDSVKEYGLKPLNVNSIQQSISTRMKQRGEGIGLDADVLQGVSKEIDRIRKVKGTVYPEDLHEIRKKAINDVIEKLNTGNTGSTQKRAASVAGDLRKNIDKVLDEASGGAWTPYLKEFQKRSKLPNEIEVGKELKSSLTGQFGNERIGALGTKIKKLSDDINPETGKPFIDQLGKGSKKTLDRVQNQFENERKIANLEKHGRPEAMKILRATETPGTPIPGLISWKVTALNKIINALQGRGGERTNRELASLMYTNPKLLGELMKNGQTPNAKIKKVTDVLMRTQAAGTANYTQQGEQ